MMQRFFDIIFSIFGLLLLSPLLVPIILLLKCTGEHEVFYFQNRIGINGRPFRIYKFATMLKNSPNIGTGTITIQDDQRVLPVGRFLRKTKINELPQLLNVLIGDMSLIGPRPLLKEAFDSYDENVKKILKGVVPGVSGIGSIVFRHEERLFRKGDNYHKFYSDHILVYKGKIEIWYAHNRTIKNYFLLIFLTIYVVFTSSHKIVFRLMKSMPTPPEELQKRLDETN